MTTPPNKAFQSDKSEEEWLEIDNSYEFLWSLYPSSFVELITAKGKLVDGYYRWFDRDTGALTISPQFSEQITQKGIGTRTLTSFRKFTVDRLGRRFEIPRETRTWRGAACI